MYSGSKREKWRKSLINKGVLNFRLLRFAFKYRCGQPNIGILINKIMIAAFDSPFLRSLTFSADLLLKILYVTATTK